VHHIAYRRAVGAAAIAACVLRVTQYALIVRRAAREAALVRPYSRPLAEHAPVMLVLGDSLAVGVGAGRAQDTIAGLLAADFPRISILNRTPRGGGGRRPACALPSIPSRAIAAPDDLPPHTHGDRA
jgi:hypothetical protein